MSDGHDSTHDTRRPIVRHLAGLSAAAALTWLCYVAYERMPWLLGGTPFEVLRLPASLAAAFAILSLGHAAGDWIKSQLGNQP